MCLQSALTYFFAVCITSLCSVRKSLFLCRGHDSIFQQRFIYEELFLCLTDGIAQNINYLGFYESELDWSTVTGVFSRLCFELLLYIIICHIIDWISLNSAGLVSTLVPWIHRISVVISQNGLKCNPVKEAFGLNSGREKYWLDALIRILFNAGPVCTGTP